MAEPLRADPTRDTYATAEAVEFYASKQALEPAEQQLFQRYLQPGARVLDLGVGAGRTTPALSASAREYVGIDYSPAMVEHCRRAYPGQRFEVADARDLAAFPDASFDVAVFSFNGIDSIPSRSGRQSCLREAARVLRPGGVFLFSVHNARYLFFRPVTAGVGPLRAVWRVAYALAHSVSLALLRLPSRAFWRGSGQVLDLALHGGLPIFVSTPECQAQEAREAGFELLEVVAAPDPRERLGPAVPWYYYACRKP